MVAILAAMAVIAVPAFAELQNVEVGGHIRIRGNWYSPEATGTVGLFEEIGHSNGFFEQRTKLSVKADFTKDVSAFIELDSYDIWGEDFRSDHITGVDFRPVSGFDVEVYQSYIETRETWGYPLTMRIGRQEIMLGSEWLVGNNDTASLFRGLSFDGITLRYDGDTWNVTGLYAKLADNSPIEQDGDVDMLGVYGSYTGFEDVTLDAYWLWVRDARGRGVFTEAFAFATPNVGVLGRIADAIEDFGGVDQYEDTHSIHTFGLRGAGTYGQFDFEAEVAYQMGNAANAVRTFFQPDPASFLAGPAFLPFGGPYAEDDADYDALGGNVELGYTFDTSYQPRLFIGGAYFEGDDNREDTFGEFVRNLFPFYVQEASISFNRLFSDWEYSEFLENTDLSNAIVIRGGVSIQPTESISVSGVVSYFLAEDDTAVNGLFGVPFFTDQVDDEIGFEVGLYMDYAYSEDLTFSLGYAHFFAGDGVDSVRGNFRRGLFGPGPFFRAGGNFIAGNGLLAVGGINDDDADYVFAETQITF
jgi:hypothetical protein